MNKGGGWKDYRTQRGRRGEKERPFIITAHLCQFPNATFFIIILYVYAVTTK